MGKTKQLLEQEWNNLTRDQLLDAEYQEYLATEGGSDES